MAIERRKFLEYSLGGLATSFTAGCLGSQDPAASETTASEPVSTPTSTMTPTTSESELVSKSLVIESRGCGEGEQMASVSFDEGVVVAGIIAGKDGCQTGELGSVSYDGSTLDVVIETRRADDAGAACTQCLTDIDYEASFDFRGDLPTRVVVTHRSMGESIEVTLRER